MMNGLPYYKAYPRDFIEGTVGMPFELKGAYRLVLDLIYMQGGELPDDARYISGLLGCSSKQWTYYRKALLGLGKIEERNGVLVNNRATTECELTANLRRTQRDNRSKRGARPSNINGIPVTTVQPKANHTDTDSDTEKRETNVSLPRKRGNPKTHTSPDARISEQMRAVAIGRGLSDAEAEAQFAKFRDRALAKGDAYADWNAAWRNWLTSPYYAPVLGAVVPLNPEKADGRPSRSDQRLDAFLRGAAG